MLFVEKSVFCLGLVMLMLLYSHVPIQAKPLPRFHERISWSEPAAHRARAHYTLEYWANSRIRKGQHFPDIPTECYLRTRLTRVLGGHKQVWKDHNSYIDPDWAQIDLAVAIRIQGQKAPEILVKLSRANWGVYELYRVDEHGLKDTFGIAHRDEGCIRWVSHKGALQRFVLVDRWQGDTRPDPPPDGKRRQERIVYRYDPKKKTWVVASSHWELYEFGADINNPVFRKPYNCPFRYLRRLRHTIKSKGVSA